MSEGVGEADGHREHLLSTTFTGETLFFVLPLLFLVLAALETLYIKGRHACTGMYD